MTRLCYGPVLCVLVDGYDATLRVVACTSVLPFFLGISVSFLMEFKSAEWQALAKPGRTP